MAFDPKDLEGIKNLKEAYEGTIAAQTKMLENQRMIAAAAGEQVGHAERVAGAAEVQLKALSDSLDVLSQDIVAREKRVEFIEAALKLEGEAQKYTDAELKALKDEIVQLNDINNIEGKGLDNLKKKLAGEIGSLEATKKRVALADELTSNMANLVGMGDKWRNTSEGQLITLLQQKGGMTDIVKLMKEKVSLENLAGNAVSQVVEATVVLAKQQDQAISSFRKATGAGAEYNSVIVDTHMELRTFGVSVAQAGASTEALYKKMASFTQMNEDAQAAVVQTSALLNTFGVSADTAAGAIDIMNMALGMTADQSAATSRELFATATALGIAPDVVFNEFGPAAKQLGGHGDNMVKVFKGMAAASKATGIEMSSLLQIAGQFDTFDTGAQAVGKMNALLGGPYLNTIDMLNASEEERIRMMIRSMEASGKQWKDMGKFERMAMANAAGISDMTEANKLFGQSLSSYDAQQRAAKDASIGQEEFEEASRNAQATWDKFNLILEAFAVNMEPVVTWLGKAADWILEVQEDMDGWFGIIVLVISGLVLFASTVATAALGMVGISAAAGPAAIGIKATGAAAKSAGKGMLFAAPGILAFGAAILGILVGVKLAAEGLSELVRAFEGLNPAQLKAVENALLGFAVTLGLIMIGLVALGAIVQGPILAGVLAIGFAMLMIGAGVYLAATGMASFTDAVGRNIEAIVTLITILPLFLMSLNGLVVLAIPAFAALMMIAYGFAAIAVALWAMPMDELAAMSEMMKAMAELGKEEVSTRVKVTVKEVLDAVSGIDEDKAVAATELVRAVQEYNLAAAEAGPNGANLMRELQATLEALRAGAAGAGRGGPQPISGGRIAGDVYFNEKLVGKWEERTKTKKWSL